jgi:hypothetical protein
MTTILWRRLDRPGHEAARVFASGDFRHLEGAAVFSERGRPCRLDYGIVCDEAWRTLSTEVSGWIGERPVAIRIEVEGGLWRRNGRAVPGLEGCLDVDLNFSPSTNLLPIRRLRLEAGQEASVSAAWLRLPELSLERLDQSYRRLDDTRYRYASAGGFAAELETRDDGLVTLYPDLWMEEAWS